MLKLGLFVVFALLSHEAFCFRLKRQSENNNEADLEDKYGWNRPSRFPWPWGYPTQALDPGFPPTTQTPNDSTVQSQVLQSCLLTCPVTSEYNPVCGNNNVTYDNPGRLFCAQACGVNVSVLRRSRCPSPTPAPA